MRRGVFLLAALMLVPFVSAEILVGQPESIYNIGDEFEIDVTLNPGSNTNDFLKLSIDCLNESVEIYRNPFNINAGENREINVDALLTNSLIGGISGDCNLKAVYGSESAQSQGFEISRLIEMDYEIQNKYNPGEKITVAGSLSKKSGSPVLGFVELRIDSLGISASSNVNGDTFIGNITIPKDAKSGSHDLVIRIFETDSSGVISNEGISTENITIEQVLSRILIEVDSQNIVPGNTLKYKVNAFDQAGDQVKKDIVLVIYEPGDFEFKEQVAASGVENSIEIGKDFSSGYWKIEASTEEFSAKKLFYVEEISEIETSLVNDTLIVTNVGNIPYEGPVEILIGSSTEIKQIKLEVGESKRFQLVAPDGEYTVSFKEGSEEVVLGNVFLTGNAIGVRDISEGIALSAANPILWAFAAILVILIIIYVNFKVKKKGKKESSSPIPQKNKAVDVLYGLKEEASIIAIKIKGEAENSPYVRESIDNALSVARNSGAKIYQDGDFKIAIFAPSLIKREENGTIAVKVAKRIEEIFNEHNRRFKDKIEFGIALNKGQIISEIKDREFKFTTVGNVISKAKRIASNLHHSALMSDEMARSLPGNIKKERVEEKDAWEVTKIHDRSRNENFLKKFR